jgi:hypothetical protein
VKGRWLPWSAEELEWIEERADWPRALLHRFFVMFFERSDVSVDALKALCLRKGWRTGRTGGFEPGHVPDNKGKKMPFNPGSARTQFKPGQTPANAKPLGHERVDAKDGYVYLLVAETNPHTGAGRRYVFKHRHPLGAGQWTGPGRPPAQVARWQPAEYRPVQLDRDSPRHGASPVRPLARRLRRRARRVEAGDLGRRPARPCGAS